MSGEVETVLSDLIACEMSVFCRPSCHTRVTVFGSSVRGEFDWNEQCLFGDTAVCV